MTVQQRIEIWSGYLANLADAQQILADSTRWVISDVDPDAMTELWAELTDSGSGVSTDGYRVLEARKGDYVAVQISPSWRNNENISATRPATYSLAGKTYVIPSGGTLLALAYPTVTLQSTSVTNVTETLLHLIILKSAEEVIQYDMRLLRDDVVTALTMPTAPSAPAAPAIAASDAAAVAPSAVTVEAAPAAPSYSAPTLAARASNPTGTIDLTTKVDGVTALTAPTAPTAPVIAYSDAAAATIGNIGTISQTTISSSSIGLLPTVPAYPTVSFGGDIGTITSAVPALLDLTTEANGVTALSPPAPPAAPTITSAGITDVSIDTLPTSPTYTGPTITLDFTDWDTQLTNEDPELMREVLQKVRAELDEFRAQIEDTANDYKVTLDVYLAGVQRNLETARIQLQERSAELSEDNRTDLENYRLSLQRHAQEMAEFNGHVEQQVAQQRANIERAVTGLATAQKLWVDKYAQDIQAASAEFAGAMQDHMREVDRLIEQARLDQQRLVEAAGLDQQRLLEQARIDQSRLTEQGRLSTEVALRNEIETLQAAIADWQADVELFRSKSQLYQIEVEAKVRQFTEQAGFDIRVFETGGSLDVSRYAAEINNARAALEANIAKHRTDMERVALVAQVARQEAEQTAREATEVALRNKAQNLAAQIADWEADLGLYRGQVESYIAQQRSIIDEHAAEEAARSQKLQMMARDRDRVRLKYEETKRQLYREKRRTRPMNVAFVEY